MKYLKQRWKQLIPCFVVFFAFNLYFFFFIQNGDVRYLGYLDILLLMPGLLLVGFDLHLSRKKEQEKEKYFMDVPVIQIVTLLLGINLPKKFVQNVGES